MKRLFLNLSVALIMIGCAQIEEPILENMTEPEELQYTAIAQTRAGTSTLDNPYSLSKVQQAYNAVASQNGLPSKTLEATDHYVKFFVADSVQYMAICDLDVELFEYPMHLDLTDAEEQAYADQDPAEGMWFWSTVSPYFVFPQGIQHEKLDDIYIQRMGGTATRAGEAQMPDEVWDSVLDEAFELSGYGPSTRAGSSWYPSATIKYRTDHPDYPNRDFALQGVKIRVSQGVNWAVVTTDANGNTGDIERNSGRLFKKPVNYKIKWEDRRWNIRSGRNGQAKTWGPKKSTSSWIKTFQGNDIDTKYATAHKALYNYVYKNQNFTLTRNLTITGINKLNTGVIDKAHQDGGTEGKFNWFNPIVGMNTVRIWLKKGSSYLPNYRVEKTMYHELGHASHYTALRRDHGAGHNILLMPTAATGEPFPDFVSYCFMESIYPGNDMRREGYLYYGLGESLRWQGFTPAQIEDIMCEEDMAAWRQRAKNMGVAHTAIVDIIFNNSSTGTPIRVNLTNPITGPDAPALNTSVTYSIPATGVVFTRWTVTPTTGVTISSPNSRSTTIRFTSNINYTLTANFTLPNGSACFSTKTINLAPPSNPPTPIIHAQVGGGAAGMPSEVGPGQQIIIFIDNYSSGATAYEWDMTGMTVESYDTDWIIARVSNNANGTVSARCRARYGSQYTGWSNMLSAAFNPWATVYRVAVPLSNNPRQAENEDPGTARPLHVMRPQ